MSKDNTINLVIGKHSNLSIFLYQKIDNIILLSAREIVSNISILKSYQEMEIKIIFNNFHPSIKLNNIDSYTQYVQQSTLVTSMVLDFFKPTQIKKIIYTSSSSVYGNNSLCHERDSLNPINFHASLKIANEKMIENYAKKFSIDYTIARIFNMYGGEDKFSIISKIINSYKYNKVLTIVNEGRAIRDFIHIDNVVEAYSKLLSISHIPIVNIGRGEGSSVNDILQFLKQNGVSIKTNNIKRDEIKVSTSDNTILKKEVGIDKFIEIKNYLREQFKL